MMLALCTAVTLERPFLVAKSKANLAMRCDLARVMIFRHSITPFALWAREGGEEPRTVQPCPNASQLATPHR